MSGTVNRVRFIAIAISVVSNRIFILNNILAFNTSKSDAGDAGSWSATLALFNPYVNGGAPAMAAMDYASVASPMDLFAIYATRSSVDVPAIPLGPIGSTETSVNVSGLKYGDVATIKSLGSASCVMIGMVDGFEETPVEMTDSPQPTFTVHGRDLTKVFYINDVFVPSTSLASAGNVAIRNPITLVVNKVHSGAQLLLDALDAIVLKDGSKSGLPAATSAALKAFGYNWRGFVRVDDTVKLDRNFQHLTASKYPPFQVQSGSTWANIQELQNAPSARLFVDECGNLLFDDTYKAWTSQTALKFVTPEDVAVFKISVSDDDLVTFFQVIPAGSLAARIPMALVTGEGAALGFGTGIAKGYTPGSTAISTFGYRHGEFSSYWDVDAASAKQKIKVLSLLHNSLERGTLVLRGTTRVRVGQRIVVPVTTTRTKTTNAVWYVEAVSNNGGMGMPWSTTLTLRFPNGGI